MRTCSSWETRVCGSQRRLKREWGVRLEREEGRIIACYGVGDPVICGMAGLTENLRTLSDCVRDYIDGR